MRDEGVIYVAGHPLLNRRCTRLPGCIRLRNDLYCVEWGVKFYSLTHSGSTEKCWKCFRIFVVTLEWGHRGFSSISSSVHRPSSFAGCCATCLSRKQFARHMLLLLPRLLCNSRVYEEIFSGSNSTFFVSVKHVDFSFFIACFFGVVFAWFFYTLCPP